VDGVGYVRPYQQVFVVVVVVVVVEVRLNIAQVPSFRFD
jgi:hypothetical protein